MLAEGVNMTGWLPDSKRILCYTQPGGVPYKIVDAETEAQIDFDLRHPEYATSVFRFSPDGEWIAFNVLLKPNEYPLFISRIQQGQPAAHDEWIQVTEGAIDSHPSWSPDGNTLYFLSTSDGFVCLWAQPLEATTKQPQGSLKEIWHFHEGNRLTGRARYTFPAITDDRLYFPLSEPKANIWLAEPQAKP